MKDKTEKSAVNQEGFTKSPKNENVYVPESEIDRTIKSLKSTRGYGDVLLAGNKISRKVIAKKAMVAIILEKSVWGGKKPEKLTSAQPYFVFDERDGMLLVGPVQEKNLAWGWVRSSDLHSWNTRQVAIDNRGDVAGFIQGWDGETALVIKPSSHDVVRVPRAELKQVQTFCNEREIDQDLYGALGLFALVKRLGLHNKGVLKALQAFVRDHHSGLLDLREVAKAIVLMSTKKDRSATVEKDLRVQQIRLLESIDQQTDYLTEVLKRRPFSTINYRTKTNSLNTSTFVIAFNPGDKESISTK